MGDGKMTGETAATIKNQENGCVEIGEQKASLTMAKQTSKPMSASRPQCAQLECTLQNTNDKLRREEASKNKNHFRVSTLIKV